MNAHRTDRMCFCDACVEQRSVDWWYEESAEACPDTTAFVEHVLIDVFKQRPSREQIDDVAAKIDRALPTPATPRETR